jgi:hypothetical protein
MARERRVRLALAGTIACALIAGGASGDGDPPSKASAAGAPTPTTPRFGAALPRIVSARVWHTRLSTVRNSNARRVGRSIASLHPTWVTGLLRYRRNQYPNRKEAHTWREIRRIVHTDSPAAQFDVVLNALQYRTPAAVTKTMRRIRHKLGNEGWFFDFFSSAFRKHPKMVRAAIASAHRHGEWIGGNAFGIGGRTPKLPARADFLSVQDNNAFRLNLKAVKRLTRKHLVTYHVHSDPNKQRGGSCRFIERLTSQERRRLVKRRAAQAARRGFHMSYPALYPLCMRARPNGPGSLLYSYNAFRDPPVIRAIRRLLNRYD